MDIIVKNIPNTLTILRIIAIPLVVIFLWFDSFYCNLIATFIYAIACVTDYLDGYFARSWKQVSSLGEFLDPVADKLLISVILFMLVSLGRIDGLSIIPGLIILSREILVSGLREFLAMIKTSIPVTKLAKCKTFVQMFSVGFLVFNNSFNVPGNIIGIIGLWFAAAITVFTGYDYLRIGLRHIRK